MSMFENGFIWHSESQLVSAIEDNPFFWPLDAPYSTGILILHGPDVTGNHFRTHLFVGPNAEAFARLWAQWIKDRDILWLNDRQMVDAFIAAVAAKSIKLPDDDNEY